MPVFVSPHYYFPHDHKWEFGGTLEQKLHEIGMFDRPGPLEMQGFPGSGADWLEQSPWSSPVQRPCHPDGGASLAPRHRTPSAFAVLRTSSSSCPTTSRACGSRAQSTMTSPRWTTHGPSSPASRSAPGASGKGSSDR